MSLRQVQLCFCLAAAMHAGSPAAIVAAEPATQTALAAFSDNEFARSGAGGVVLVARNGRAILRRAYGLADQELGVGMSADHVFGIGSITKQFTAAAILQLVEQGKLRLDTDARTLVPGLATYDRPLTIEQLLSHTAGLPNIVDLPEFSALARKDLSVGELLELTARLPLHFTPGTSFRYSDTGYFALGAIIETVSGLPYADYIETRIFKPLGMSHSAYLDARVIPRRARGYSAQDHRVMNAPYMSPTVPFSAGGLGSTVDDLLRWHVALRSGAVVSDALREKAWQGRTLPDGERSGYGFGWKSCDLAGRDTIEHGGFVNGYLAYALQVRADDIDVIVLTNNDAAEPDPSSIALGLARLALTGSAHAPIRRLNAVEQAKIAGEYKIKTGGELKITSRDGELYGRRGASRERKLAALSPAEFLWEPPSEAVRLTVEYAGDGRAERVSATLRCEPMYTARRTEPLD